jgi:hypothetical protein
MRETVEATAEDVTITEVQGVCVGVLLIEVAQSCEYAARFTPGSLSVVEVRASVPEVLGMAVKLTRAVFLFQLRQWEAVAEVVRTIGGEPSEALLLAIARAWGRAEAFSTTDEGRDDQDDPSNN